MKRYYHVMMCLWLLLPAVTLAQQVVQSSAAVSDTEATVPVVQGDARVVPYGANLFSGGSTNKQRPATSNPNYQISAGDQVAVKMWGANSFDQSLTVDNEGNVFLPEIGPVKLSGLKQSEVNGYIQKKVGTVYKDNVQVYTSLAGSLPVSVFVAGAVKAPGRYVGVSTDSILDYVNQAGGIDPVRGSYRTIRVLRGNSEIFSFDIYAFMRDGTLPAQRLAEGDTILVTERGQSVAVTSGAMNAYAFEFTSAQTINGAALMAYASPLPGASNVSISGIREAKTFKAYVTMPEFQSFALADGDVVDFVQGTHHDQISISVEGMHDGAKKMVLPPNARLREVLANIRVNDLSAVGSTYVRRKSVAARQKLALQDSLKRLQETMLLARTSGVTEAPGLTDAEAKVLDAFIQRAGGLEPEGRVVVVRDGATSDIALEQDDEIVIPQKTDVVMVNGEVMVPQAIVWNSHDNVGDYIAKAGGFTDRANESQLVVIHANGATEIGSSASVQAGDEVLVLPEVKLNNLQVAGQVMDVIYKAAIAVAVPLKL